MGLWLIDEVIYEGFFADYDKWDNNDGFNACRFSRNSVYYWFHIEDGIMTQETADAVKAIMADMNFHPTDILMKTMLDLFEQFSIIDPKILAVIVKRAKGQKEPYNYED